MIFQPARERTCQNKICHNVDKIIKENLEAIFLHTDAHTCSWLGGTGQGHPKWGISFRPRTILTNENAVGPISPEFRTWTGSGLKCQKWHGHAHLIHKWKGRVQCGLTWSLVIPVSVSTSSFPSLPRHRCWGITCPVPPPPPPPQHTTYPWWTATPEPFQLPTHPLETLESSCACLHRLVQLQPEEQSSWLHQGKPACSVSSSVTSSVNFS